MKILVTGATGFIGSHLIKRLQPDHTIHALVRPSTAIDQLIHQGVHTHVFDGTEELITFMQEQKFDGVIHLASLFLAQHKPSDIYNLVESNISFSTALLEAATHSSTGWFINTGTFWQHYEQAEYSPVNLYAATKEAFQDIAQYYLETSLINFVTLKLSDTFGPNDTRPKVLNLLNKIGKSGETLEMSGGEQLLDISYIENVIDGYMSLITLLAQENAVTLRGKSFALKSGQTLPLKKIADIFSKVTGMKLNIAWGARPYRPREVMTPWSTGETIPGWEPKVSLEEGIKRTFNE